MKALTVLESASCAHELPTFLQDIRDFEELMRSCDVMAAHVKQLLRRALDNAHIQTGREDCIAGWESGLGLTPESADLEQRRSAVIDKLSTVNVVNEASIMALTDELFGAVAYQASMDVETLTLTLETEGTAVVNIPPDGPVIAQAVEDALRPVLPMNVRINNIMKAQVDAKLVVGSASFASLQATIQVSP